MTDSNERKQLKAEVYQAVLEVMREAEKAGVNPMSAAETKFPGIPDGIIFEVFVRLEAETEEAWWQTVERTIDGEIVGRAMQVGGKK